MILLVVLLGLLACAGLAPLLARRLGRDAGYPLAAVFAAGTAAIALQGPAVVEGRPVVLRADWIPAAGITATLRLDGLALLFSVLVLGVGALVLAYCARYLEPGSRHGRLYTLLTLFAASMLGLVLAADLVLLLVFWEATSVCSFLLIGGDGRAGRAAATRAFLVTGAGGLALLAGVALAVTVAGTSDLTALLDDPAVLQDTKAGGAVAWLVMAAAFTKSAQVPFHFWLPEAMVAITPVSAYLHAATMVKAGVYLLARFSPVWAGQPRWTATLVAVGLASALFGALLALRQHDLKALLAYSTVSQLGWLVTLIGIGTPLAMAAALLHTFAHALFKASLFMLVGIVDREAGSRDVRDLAGLRRMMPVTATAAGLAALSMAGVPPMIGFVSKEESFIAFLDESAGAPGLLAAAGAVLAAAFTAAYGLRLFVDAFTGIPRQRLYEPATTFLAPAVLAAAAGLALGPAVPWLSPVLGRVVADARRTPAEVDLALWHGLNPALGLSALALAGGVLLFRARDRVDRALHAAPARIRAAAVFDRLHEGLLDAGCRVAVPSRRLERPGQLAIVLATAVVGGAAVLAATAGGFTEPRAGVTRPADAGVVVLLTLAVAGLAVTRVRLAAVALLGAVGFVLAVWYLRLGGADVALTQLLVETLTVVVVVLVLRRMPARFPRARGGPVLAVAAVGAGLVAGAGAYLLTGRGPRSEVGATLLREAEPQTGGTNVVNTVLVDFRGIDTLGEVAVLVTVAVSLGLVLRLPPLPREEEAPLGAADGFMLRTLARPLVPVLGLIAGYLLVRGHDEPGGGFIAGLVAASALVLRRFVPAAPQGRRRARRADVGAALAGGGLGLALLTGGTVLATGRAFLEPVKAAVGWGPLGATEVSSSLVFDAGVLLVVLALVALSLRGLGGER
jgi:multicomponent Na+:H+ antiporter subunit A